jgi:hypothetical protein
MSTYCAIASGVILHDQMIASCISHEYALNMIPFSLLCLACGPDLSNRYLTPTGYGLVKKITYPGSRHPMKAIRVIVTPCFPQPVKITILAKNYGKLKDVNL